MNNRHSIHSIAITVPMLIAVFLATAWKAWISKKHLSRDTIFFILEAPCRKAEHVNIGNTQKRVWFRCVCVCLCCINALSANFCANLRKLPAFLQAVLAHNEAQKRTTKCRNTQKSIKPANLLHRCMQHLLLLYPHGCSLLSGRFKRGVMERGVVRMCLPVHCLSVPPDRQPVLSHKCDIPSLRKDDQSARDNRLPVHCRRFRSLRHCTVYILAATQTLLPSICLPPCLNQPNI